jgi:hypothetical protein
VLDEAFGPDYLKNADEDEALEDGRTHSRFN